MFFRHALVYPFGFSLASPNISTNRALMRSSNNCTSCFLPSIIDITFSNFSTTSSCKDSSGSSTRYSLTLVADKFGCELPLFYLTSCSRIAGESKANIKYSPLTLAGSGRIITKDDAIAPFILLLTIAFFPNEPLKQ